MFYRHSFCVALLATAVAAYGQYTAYVLPSPVQSGFARAISGTQIVGETSQFGNGHALLWSSETLSYVSLHPDGFEESSALGVGGGKQVGYALQGERNKALMWSGSANDYVSLDRTEFISTFAYATDGIQQVGEGATPGYRNHALLWSGSAASMVDLNPGSQFRFTVATGVWGGRQVGYGQFVEPPSQGVALLWSGSAQSVVSLHPSGYSSSAAFGIHGDQQVGSADSHAILWFGSATNYVNLNPKGGVSAAIATNGFQQVGRGGGPGLVGGALVWTGSAASVHSLHQYLPSGYEYSEATGIAEDGTIVGYAFDTGPDIWRAIVWEPVPEPCSLAVLSLGVLNLARKRRTKV